MAHRSSSRRPSLTVPGRVLAGFALAFGCAPADDEAADDPTEAEAEARAEVEAGGPTPQAFVAPGGRGEEVEVDESGAVVTRAPRPASVTPVDPEELAERQRESATFLAAAPIVDITDRTLDDMASRPATEAVRLLVSVDAPGFDFTRLRDTNEATRSASLEARKADVAAAQAPVEAALVGLGAHVSGRRWISTHLVVEATAGDVEEIASLPGVTKVVEDAAGQQSGWYDGNDVRREMLVEDLLDSGYDGLFGAHVGGKRIKLGIVEADPGVQDNWPDPDHVGWRSYGGSTWSRLQFMQSCNFNGCTSSSGGDGDTHGSAVMWAAGGDITDDQDPYYTYNTSQERRSGVAEEAKLYYYNGGGFCSGYESAIESMVSINMDVINMSLSIPNGQCDPAFDCMTDAIEAAQAAGTLVVAAAGNDGYWGGCTVEYPALLPQVLAVGATQSNDNVDYDDQFLMDRWFGFNHVGSARGPVPFNLAVSGSNNTAGVDLVAPGIWRRHFTDANNYSAQEMTGTSMAAPLVAGIAADMRDMFHSLGSSAGVEAETLFVNMLLLGDNFEMAPVGDRRTQVSDYTGYGRAKVHFPSSASLEGPWGWGWRAEHLDAGETKTWTVGGSGPESYSVEELKWAVTWFDHLLDASDVVIRIYDTCPPGGGAVQVAYDVSYNLRKTIHLLGDEIGGRCLEMRATAYQTPPGGVTIYSADYWHGGDPDEH